MNNITVIIPIHDFNEEIAGYLKKAINSVIQNKPFYDGNLKILLIVAEHILNEIKNFSTQYITNRQIEYSIISNNMSTDFCSQVNFAAKQVDSEFFSILEFDDEYTSIWFKSVKIYYYTHEDVSVFLPINVQTDAEETFWKFGNEIAWASSFSNELGYIDFDCLENYSAFNITGGVFNTNDFNRIGGLKPSIKIAFNYEFLLRLTNKGLKVFVVPKEGYKHIIMRSNSLTDFYNKAIPSDEVHKWFELAKREYSYTEDRNKDIIRDNIEEIK